MHVRRYLTEHYNVYLAVFLPTILVWIWARFAWASYRRKRRGEIFPPLESVDLKFHEIGASGNSDKSFLSRLGGASRCLELVVTDSEVWVRVTGLFFAESDLEHRIPRASVLSAELTPSLLSRRRVCLAFRLADGTTRRLALVLHNPSGFLAALKVPPALTPVSAS
jgi:hypothetical protein